MFSFDQFLKSFGASRQQPLQERLTNDLVRKAKAHLSKCCEVLHNDTAYESPIKFQLDKTDSNGSSDGQRFIVSNSFFSLIVCGNQGTIDVFVLPVGEGKSL